MSTSNSSSRARLVVSVWALSLLIGLPAGATRVSRQGFMPATFQPRTDALGFQWDLSQYGQINHGQNYCFSGALRLQVNGQQFRAAQSQMTPDGSQYVLTATVAGMAVTRRIKIDAATSTVRYVETFSNRGSAPASVTAALYTQLGNQCQMVVSSSGRPNPTTLTKDDRGLIAVQDPRHNRPSVLFFAGALNKTVTPVFAIQNNYTINCSFSLSVPPGKDVSVVHGIAQRRIYALPGKEEMEKTFAPFWSKKWVKDLPSDVRKSVVNLKRSFMGSAPGFMSIDQLLGQPRGTADVLAVGENTRLRGKASCRKLTVDSRYGTVEIPFAKAAAIMGGKRAGNQQRIFLRNGQVITGKVTAEDLVFTMNTGLKMTIDVDSLDMLMTRAESSDGVPPPNAWLFVETFGGDRLAIVRHEAEPLSVLTPWGGQDINLQDILSVRFVAEDIAGYQVHLQNGSAFFGLLSSETLRLKTDWFGMQVFAPQELKAITAVAKVAGNGRSEDEMARHPHVVLVGDNTMTGHVDADAIVFVVFGEQIPVPPTQIQLLENQGAEDDRSPDGPLFLATLWDGDVVSGRVLGNTIPFRFADARAAIPAWDILSVSVPAPTVPEALRVEISGLIKDLGNPDWRRREAATQRLGELGVMAKAQLSETLMVTRDAEVRERVKGLLDELGD